MVKNFVRFGFIVAIALLIGYFTNLEIKSVSDKAVNDISSGSFSLENFISGLNQNIIISLSIIVLFVAAIVFAIIFIIKSSKFYFRILSLIALLSLLGVPTYSLYNGITSARESVINAIVKKHQDQLFTQLNNELTNMTPQQVSDFKDKTGYTPSEAKKLIESKNYLKAFEILPKDKQANILRKANVDPNNIFVKTMLNNSK